jgi:hypothetical protein
MITTRVKIFKDIPDEATLKAMMEDYKDSGAAKVGWSRQNDGRYRLEVFIDDKPSLPAESTFSSPASGEAMYLG